MKLLGFYDSTDAQQLAAALTAQQILSTPTLKDVNGVSEADLNTYIDALTADNYDECRIWSALTDTGGSGILSYDSYAKIRAKMVTASKGTLITSGTTVAAGSDTSHAELPAGSSIVNDFYNKMIEGDFEAKTEWNKIIEADIKEQKKQQKLLFEI